MVERCCVLLTLNMNAKQHKDSRRTCRVGGGGRGKGSEMLTVRHAHVTRNQATARLSVVWHVNTLTSQPIATNWYARSANLRKLAGVAEYS